MRSFGSFLLIGSLFLAGQAVGRDKAEKREKGSSMSIPIPVGHGASGVKIPYYGDDGKLQMNFQIGDASRTDDLHLQMTNLRIETFNETGLQEMTMFFPNSILDLKTRVISSNTPVTIKRTDFELTGDTMLFNTVSRQGTLGGNIRMLIFNLDETSNTKQN